MKHLLFAALLSLALIPSMGFADHHKTIDINTATAKELMTLKGIGKLRAQTIIEYRKKHGYFDDFDALRKVPGIGPRFVSDNHDRINFNEPVVGQKTVEKAKQAASHAASETKEAAHTAAEKTQSVTNAVAEKAKKAANTTTDAVKSAAQNTKEAAKSAASTVVEGTKKAAEATGDTVMKGVDAVTPKNDPVKSN